MPLSSAFVLGGVSLLGAAIALFFIKPQKETDLEPLTQEK
jgi:hypothetical protein